MDPLRSLYVLHDSAFRKIYGPQEQAEIAARVTLIAPPQTAKSLATRPDLLEQVELIFSGWGAPIIDEAFLNAAPNLKAIFYGAGAVGSFTTPAVWERGIVVTSAYAANAIPVAEFTMATIIFSLKHGWSLSRRMREQRTSVVSDGAPGTFGSTVGLISLGIIARQLIKLLQHYELEVLLYDPFVTAEEAQELGVELTSLEDLFRRSDVASLHTPLLKETVGMITGAHLDSMKPGATFINTARGRVVREDELIDVLSRRPDLQAVLDVTVKEPPEPDSPLYTLPNVVLTPHIAGSIGTECRRMGRYMVDELKRYLNGKPLTWAITPELAATSSHRPVAKSSFTPTVIGRGEPRTVHTFVPPSVSNNAGTTDR